MKIAKRVVAVFLVLTALAVFFNLILTPVYHDGRPDYPVWKILNYFMVAGTLVVLIAGVVRRKALMSREGDPGVIEYLRVNAAFYGAIVLAMLFFWEWFWTLNPDSETGGAVTSHLVYFPIVDSLYTVLCLATGHHLWTESCGGSDTS